MTLFDRWRQLGRDSSDGGQDGAAGPGRRPSRRARMRRERLDDETVARLGLDGDAPPARLAQLVEDEAPWALDRSRIVEWLVGDGYSYFVDSEGDLGGLWQGRLFYFLLFGERQEILQVRGQWNRDLTIERLEEILEVCNEWNADRIWPKAYARVRDNGMIQVYTEVTVDLEFGANDGQLGDVLQCGLSTASLFFDTLDDTYPDPLRSAP